MPTNASNNKVVVGPPAWLAMLDGSPASYVSCAREIDAHAAELALVPLSVGCVSTFTLDLIRPYLMVEGARRGFLISPFFAPFNQLEQQLLDPQSALYHSKPEVIVIAARLEELSPGLVHRFTTFSKESLDTEVQSVMNRLKNLVQTIRANTTASVLVFNQAEPLHLAAGLADTQLPCSQRAMISQFNQKLADLSRQYPNVYLFDYSRLLTELGLNAQDLTLWYMARIPFSASTQMEVGTRLARYLRALRRPASKCLVVDLDNTLWGGVLGEDGAGQIKIGEGYPGRVFSDFQHYLLSLRDRGILLAIASKNNEADVVEFFSENKEMILKLDDFSARQIHWNDKAGSLSAIAADLHIATDALVFFDDQPMEREWIRSRLPEVAVIDVPSNPLGYIQALESSGVFDQLSISEEDRNRASTFQHEHQRLKLQQQSVSMEDFLLKLNVAIQVGRVNSESLPRVTQLIGKTNQFNLTSRRYTSSELQQLMDSGAQAFWVRAQDRFDSYGLVGAAVAVPDSNAPGGPCWRLDLFLLSCRVLGRQVESAFLSAISHLLRSQGGTLGLLGEYLPSSKNSMTANFYQKHGFQTADTDIRFWRWDLNQSEIPAPPFVTLTYGKINGSR